MADRAGTEAPSAPQSPRVSPRATKGVPPKSRDFVSSEQTATPEYDASAVTREPAAPVTVEAAPRSSAEISGDADIPMREPDGASQQDPLTTPPLAIPRGARCLSLSAALKFCHLTSVLKDPALPVKQSQKALYQLQAVAIEARSLLNAFSPSAHS